MSFLTRIIGRERRANSMKTSDPYLAEFFGQGMGGGYVDVTRASGIAVAHRCISLIAELMASTPLHVYRRDARGGRDRAPDYPLYSVLHDTPNESLTAFELRERLIADLLIHGNAYAEIVVNGRGQVTTLKLLDFRTVSIERLAGGRRRYKIGAAPGRVLLAEEVLHLRYRLAPDGFTGLSPIQLTRETFGLALTQSDTAAKQSKKAFRPEGALVFPNSLSKEGRTESMTLLGKRIADSGESSGVFVLDGGAEWRSFAFSSKDAEFLESRKLTALDICRVFGVPPSAAGITDNATYSNIGEESRALVQRCLAPMAARIEQAMNTALLSTEARKTLFIEHDLAGLLRGDLGARYTAYQIGRQGGWLSPNEIRRLENMPEIDGGDEYLSPLNMQKLGTQGG